RPRYLHGHRGYSKYRPGYRRHNDGWFYPPAAFIIGGIIVDSVRRANRSHALPARHYAWCDRRYKSYRAWDDTFQPYHGPRRTCNSPFDGR
ncbi:MAG TPA: BA14K family protein, partial [Rhizobiaceae bacterium]|nr:BA14K family protein [Rhizobiaceae bacterium]